MVGRSRSDDCGANLRLDGRRLRRTSVQTVQRDGIKGGVWGRSLTRTGPKSARR